jgi:hypothetical protein
VRPRESTSVSTRTESPWRRWRAYSSLRASRAIECLRGETKRVVRQKVEYISGGERLAVSANRGVELMSVGVLDSAV